MGKKKRRNTNKEKESIGGSGKIKAGDSYQNNDSDVESEFSDATHLSLDEDMQSVVGDAETDETLMLNENDEGILNDKLAEFLENATHKNSSMRLSALANLQLLLSKQVMTEVLNRWKMTLIDVLEKAVKRSAQESIVAIKVFALFILQMGTDVSDVIDRLIEMIKSNCIDSSISDAIRSESVISLGICGYLCIDELEPLLQCVQCLRSVWISIKSGNTSVESVAALFCASLASWGLLLEQLPSSRIEQALANDLPKLCSYFESNQVDIRIAAGESLAHLYELGVRLFNDWNYRPSNHQQTVEMLELLSTDSLKYRAKRERRVQRCSFRQVLAAIKNKESICLPVKFGSETLELDSWASKLFYDVSCQSLRGGMNAHLKRNLLLREIFQLGPVLGDVSKMSKSQRAAIQGQIRKARTLHRGKQRDKRTEPNTISSEL